MSNQKLNIGNSQKEKIVTEELIINQKVLIYKETIIPLNNISRINIISEERKPYQIYTVILIVLGIIFLFSKATILLLIGLLMLGIGFWLIYRTYIDNLDLGEYLILNLNSGKDIYLFTKKHDFAIEIMDVIINCINSGEEYKVNMSNCKIETCQFTENNTILR